jgi:xylono-1,5-lactonase
MQEVGGSIPPGSTSYPLMPEACGLIFRSNVELFKEPDAMDDIQLFHQRQHRLGESIMWHDVLQCLFWIDLLEPALFRADAQGNNLQSWPLNLKAPLGAICATEDPDLLLISHRHGLSLLNIDNLSLKDFANPENGRDQVSFNDLKIDRWQRCWVGSSHVLELEPRGALWCVASADDFALGDAGFAISNGPAFSTDGATMYFNDSLGKQTLTYDITASSLLPRNRRVLRTYTPEEGLPDGNTVDAEGNIWTAHWGGSQISQMTPSGVVIKTYAVPALNVTTLCFGGEDYRTLYITTARDGMSASQLEAQPLSGSLFVLQPGTQGLAEPLFKI